MTLHQLKYVKLIAQSGSLSKAAERAYVSQPSLSVALKELEAEIGVELFTRSNRGLQITAEGNEFLTYAGQVVDQFTLMEDKYLRCEVSKKKFAVSTQHYSFVVHAFINMAKKYDMEEYEFALRETKTWEVIEDVAHLRSELGILYLNEFNTQVLNRVFKEKELQFTLLFSCPISVYLWGGHPLQGEEKITMEQLQEYPCLSFEQGAENSFFFAEEVLSTYGYKRSIKVNDRATMLNLMKGLLGYTLCSGILSQQLNGGDYVVTPLDTRETMDIGYIKKKNIPLSALGQIYLEEISKLYS